MATSSQQALRIATFNVHFGKNDTGIARALKDNENLRGAKVILLQEIEDHKKEGDSRAKKIADALSLEYIYAPSRTVKDIGTHGLAILSAYPITDIETIVLPYYRLHVSPRSRIALIASIRVGDMILRIANVHLDTRLNSGERIEQLRPVVEHLKRYPGQKAVLGGDFNLLPFRFRWTVPFFLHNQKIRVEEYLSDEGFSSHYEHGGYTFKRGLLRFELDAIYTANADIVRGGVERSIRISDHKPLWVDADISTVL